MRNVFTHTRLVARIVCLAAVASLAACAGMSERERNTATGAAVGGAAGAVITGGSAAGTVGGAAVGGIIGNQVDRKK